MREILRWAEFLLVLVRGILCSMSVMLSSSSTFRCTYLTFSTAIYVRKKNPRAHTRRTETRLQEHCCRYSKTAAVALPFQNRTQNAHRHILHIKSSRLRLLAKAHLSQKETTALFAT